jgi:transporter family protein
MSNTSPWFFWAILSAVFAAMTAIFAKLGIKGVDSDLATLVRTAIILIVLSAFVWFAGKWSNPFELPARTWLFLGLSGLATGASWVCYFRALQLGEASKVAPVDKMSLVLVAIFAFTFLGERPSLREWLGIAMVAGGVLVLAFRYAKAEPTERTLTISDLPPTQDSVHQDGIDQYKADTKGALPEVVLDKASDMAWHHKAYEREQ